MSIFITGPLKGESAEYSRDSSRRELIYRVFEADTLAAATALVTAAIASEYPLGYDGYPLTSVAAKNEGAGCWSYTVAFTPRGRDDTKRWRGSTAGGRATRTHALRHISEFRATGYTGEMPQVFGAINVEEGKPKGVEIIVPAFNFTLEKKILPELLPADYVSKMYLLTGTTNDIPVVFLYRGQWLSFDVGNMRIEGFDFDIPNATEANFSWTFNAEPAIVNSELGQVPGVSKKGQEYAWPYYEPMASAGSIVPKLLGLYVDKVYPAPSDRGPLSWAMIGDF